MEWRLESYTKKLPKMNKPILIEGLPGIGNVGKIAADFLIIGLKARKLGNLFSYSMPNSVFVNENNMAELPLIELYYKKMKSGNDLLILTGDTQPIDERASYEFCEFVLDIFTQAKGSQIVTLGGIGLQEIPKSPNVHITGNDKKLIDKYVKINKINSKLFGIVGPIIGASGLLIGLSKKRDIPAVCLLAESLSHPSYLGIKGSKELLKVLVKTYKLDFDFEKIDKEIVELDNEVERFMKGDIDNAVGKKLKKYSSKIVGQETSYIG